MCVWSYGQPCNIKRGFPLPAISEYRVIPSSWHSKEASKTQPRCWLSYVLSEFYIPTLYSEQSFGQRLVAKLCWYRWREHAMHKADEVSDVARRSNHIKVAAIPCYDSRRKVAL